PGPSGGPAHAPSRCPLNPQVRRQRALVAVDRQEVGRLIAVMWWAPRASVVAPHGHLDLDELGAEVSEQQRGVREREHPLEPSVIMAGSPCILQQAADAYFS